YKTVPSVRLVAVNPNSIMVLAAPADQMDIAALIKGPATKDAAHELLRLTILDASTVASTLKGKFGDSSKTPGSPFIEAQPDQGGVMVSGTAEQVKDIKDFLKQLGEKDPEGKAGVPTTATRIITLDKVSGVSLAEALQYYMSRMRKNPVRIVGPE